MLVVNALILGFSTGGLCLVYCLPILAPLMLSREDSSLRASLLSWWYFILGRFVAYLCFGLIVGLVGQYTKEALFFQAVVVPILFIILGALMIIYGVVQTFHLGRLCFIKKSFLGRPRHLFLVGFLAGVNLCPPFLMAISYAVTLGEIINSVIFFLAFFLATTVFILPFIFSGLLSRFRFVRFAARIAAVIAGCRFIYTAAFRLLV